MTESQTIGGEADRSCPRCGATFVCGMAAAHEECWCADLPRVMPVPDGDSVCLCRDCLEREIARRLNQE